VAAADAPLIAVVGPTASGKSALALRLALRHRGEIVSCDSLSVYRGFDIGSAKPTAEERERVRHHLVDVVDPGDGFSAADYARRARRALREITDRGRLPIVAGGTGLYLKALLQGLFAGPSRDPALRARLEAIATRFGDTRLHRLLLRVDPAAASRIPANDRVRVVRALEVFARTGKPLSELHGRGAEALRGYTVLVVGLRPGRAALRAAVERRTDRMIASGLVDEVRALLGRGYPAELRPLQAIGYRQAVRVVRGEATLEEARRDIVQATLRFAKRQMTWFRHQADVSWCPDAAEAETLVDSWLGRPDAPVPLPRG
jgi:tRNA dimethylallyltransferase